MSSDRVILSVLGELVEPIFGLVTPVFAGCRVCCGLAAVSLLIVCTELPALAPASGMDLLAGILLGVLFFAVSGCGAETDCKLATGLGPI